MKALRPAEELDGEFDVIDYGTGEVVPMETERTPEQWAQLVNASWRETLEGVLNTGRLLAAAREDVGHGGWGAVCARIEMSPSTAHRLMAVARHPRLSNRAHAHDLPRAWVTLYELTKLTEAEWDIGLAKRLISPEMERKDIAAIKAVFRKEKSPARLNAGEAGLVELRQDTAVDFLSSIPSRSVDLLLTDPPYSTDVDDIAAFAREWVGLALSRVRTSGRAYIFAGAYPRELKAYLDVLDGQDELRLGNVLVWTYRNTLGPSPKDDYKLNWQACFHLYGEDAAPLDAPVMLEQLTVQEVNAPDARSGIRYHAWQKPDELAERLIRHSTRPLDLVCDPFAGTGAFLAAAARLGRNATGCDRDPGMLAFCRERGLEVAGAA